MLPSIDRAEEELKIAEKLNPGHRQNNAALSTTLDTASR